MLPTQRNVALESSRILRLVERIRNYGGGGKEDGALWGLRCFPGHILNTTTARNINSTCILCSPKSLNGLNVQGVFRGDYRNLPSSLTSYKVLSGSLALPEAIITIIFIECGEGCTKHCARAAGLGHRRGWGLTAHHPV